MNKTRCVAILLGLLTAGCTESAPSRRPPSAGAPTEAPAAAERHPALSLDSHSAVLSKAPVARFKGRRPPRVVFLNPGRSDETFWNMVAGFMSAVVEDLPVELEMLTAERDHILMRDMVRRVCQRTTKPDYLLLVDEKDTGASMLEISEAAGVRCFLLLNPLSAKPAKRLGGPREHLKTWIGALIVDQERAGYDIGKSLLRAARQRLPAPAPLPALAISGNQSTTAAIERNKGLTRALSEDPDAGLQQMIFSQWRRDKAARQSAGLLRRYPETRLIWAANDDMALGALEAARAQGLTPGEGLFVSGLNWATDALTEVRDGHMAASIGGHFMGGGWALIMLFDHYHGLDFASPEPTRKLVMGTIDLTNVGPYLERFGDRDWSSVDFTRFSKAHDSELEAYEFSVTGLLAHTR